jgi:hypothetical protein
MILARFGPTWDTAYPFGIVKGSDDWQAELTDTLVRVSPAASFSIEGQLLGPVAPLVASKRWILGPGLTEVETERILYGTGEHFGVGTVWGELRGVSWELGDLDQTLDELRKRTLGAGESKLWGLTRDEQHRWIWAKAIHGRFQEGPATRLHLPVELTFYCREGIWYGETLQVLTIDSTQPASFALVNAGDRPAALFLSLVSSANTLTRLTLLNTTNNNTCTWSGSALPGWPISLDTAAWRIQIGAYSGYTGFSYGAEQATWLQLEPGLNDLTLTIEGSDVWSGYLTWWDTYQ